MGKDHASVPAHLGISLAGGSHHARHRGGSKGRDPAYAQGLHRFLCRNHGDPCRDRSKDRKGEVRRRGGYLYHRADDAQRRCPAGRHLALFRRRLCQELWHHLCRQGQQAPLSAPDLMGHLHAYDRCADHGAQRRRRLGSAAAHRADPGGRDPRCPAQGGRARKSKRAEDRSGQGLPRQAGRFRPCTRLEVCRIRDEGRAGARRDRPQGHRKGSLRRGAPRYARKGVRAV